MALKTFNLDKEVYEEYSRHCRKEGISMSKKIENFIKSELEMIKSPEMQIKTTPKDQSDHPLKKYC